MAKVTLEELIKGKGKRMASEAGGDSSKGANTLVSAVAGRATMCAIPGNICKLKVDVIVNAANERLMAGGGVCGFIHDAAGPNLAKECRELRGCATGDAKMTKAYKLPSKFVAHAVGPIWYGGEDNEEEDLKSCYRRVIEISSEAKAKSIAFPCISTGIYNFPTELAAKTAISSVGEALKADALRNGTVEDVLFCCFSKKDLELYNRLLPQWEAHERKMQESSESKQEESKVDIDVDTDGGASRKQPKLDIDTENEPHKEGTDMAISSPVTKAVVKDSTDTVEEGTVDNAPSIDDKHDIGVLPMQAEVFEESRHTGGSTIEKDNAVLGLAPVEAIAGKTHDGGSEVFADFLEVAKDELAEISPDAKTEPAVSSDAKAGVEAAGGEKEAISEDSMTEISDISQVPLQVLETNKDAHVSDAEPSADVSKASSTDATDLMDVPTEESFADKGSFVEVAIEKDVSVEPKEEADVSNQQLSGEQESVDGVAKDSSMDDYEFVHVPGESSKTL